MADSPLASAKELSSSKESTTQDDTIPDGGARAWLTLLGGFCTTTATFGYINSFGVFQDIYTRSHAASASRISWIGSTQLGLLIAMGLPAGKLLDMGYFRQTIFAGSCIYVFSLFMVSLAHPDKYYQIFLSQGLGMGIGSGLLYVPVMAVQAHHFRTKRPLAMGIVVTGSSIGGIFFPIMLNQLFQSSVGFAWGVRASAFIVLGLLVIANCLMRPRAAATSRDKPKPSMKVLFTDVPYMFGVFSALFGIMGIFFPYFYLQLFAILHGVDPTFAFYLLAILNASSIPGRIIPAGLANKYGLFNLLIFSLVACSVMTFALFGVRTVAGTVVFAVLFGFFSGGFLALISPANAAMARDESEIGIRLGVGYFLSSLGALTGTPISGALLGTTFPWSRAIVFSAVLDLAAAAFMLVTRQIISYRKSSQLV